MKRVGIVLDMPCHWRYVLDNLFKSTARSLSGTPDQPQAIDFFEESTPPS